MKISIRGISLIYLTLLVLLASNLAGAEQEGLAYKEKAPKDVLNKQYRKQGHLYKS